MRVKRKMGTVTVEEEGSGKKGRERGDLCFCLCFLFACLLSACF